MSGGKRNTRGTPQGGVASPLLANIHEWFLKHWRLICGDTFQAHVVSMPTTSLSQPRPRGGGTSVDEGGDDQARVDDQRDENYAEKRPTGTLRPPRLLVGALWFEANGRWYLGASPSKKCVQRFKTRVGDSLVPSNTDPWPKVRDKLNRSPRGWSNYFGYGSRARHTVASINTSLNDSRFARRHKSAQRRFTFDVIHRELGVVCLQRLP
jgi:RNA-directed DNA polymerase